MASSFLSRVRDAMQYGLLAAATAGALTLTVAGIQAIYVRRTVQRLGPAPGPTRGKLSCHSPLHSLAEILDTRQTVVHEEGHVGGGGGQKVTEKHLLFLGDSVTAGVGCPEHAQALTGLTARAVQNSLGPRYSVEYSAFGLSGADCGTVIEEVLPQVRAQFADSSERPTYDAVVISIGVNHVLRGHTTWRFKADFRQLVREIRGITGETTPVFLVGLPPLHRFPALPQPLRFILGLYTHVMDRAANSVCSTLQDVRHITGDGTKFSYNPLSLSCLGDEFFGSDGFHPGPLGCATMAGLMAPVVASVIGKD